MTAGGADRNLQARDIVAFGQEYGRVLSDGRIVGRAEPFAKVFPSSRAVKRAVGAIAWAILEDIALDARLDGRGRLVADTNVRRLADNLGLATNTVAKHLGRLREHGFVLHEENRDDTSGLYAQSRYVLDPSACLERFTHTPPSSPDRRAVDNRVSTPDPATVDNPGAESTDRPESTTEGVSAPCSNSCDTVAETVSQSMRHRDLRHNKDVVVGEEEQQQQTPRTSSTRGPSPGRDDAAGRDRPGDPRGEASSADPVLVDRLLTVGVAASQARALVAAHPADQVADVLDAVEMSDAHSPAGWVVTAVRDAWDVSEAADEVRRARAGRRREAELAAARQVARRREERHRERSAGWAAAVSAALDDSHLARAIRRHTTPVSGVVARRSVPVAVAQLVGWAAAAHVANPAVSLEQLLPRVLARPTSSRDAGAARGSADGDVASLPEPPPPSRTAEPLRDRVERLLPAIDRPRPARPTKEIVR